MKKQSFILVTVGLLVLIGLLIFLAPKPEGKRPQEPKKPYAYRSEDITFFNSKDKITLAGTLTLPKNAGKFPAVILVTGSGAHNRDEELYGHKPFLVLSDHLTKNGIAVLRFDDRGYGKSTGDFASATTLDFSFDVESAVEYLKTRSEINITKIGLVGHSEGGMVAPLTASRSKDVNFMVLLAGVGITGKRQIISNNELIGKGLGLKETEIQEINKPFHEALATMDTMQDINALKVYMEKFLSESFDKIPSSYHHKPAGISKEQFVRGQVEVIASPWFQYLFNHDPAQVLQKVTCSVLALNGEKDWQVGADENLNTIANALKEGGNEKVTTKKLANLNHLFQECETGNPSEYVNIQQTFSPIALGEISSWIKQQIK